jgi:threonine synthase
MGFTGQGGIWIKNETGNVSGSHKGRHLFSVLVHLEVVEALGLGEISSELVIASCGNAALAAAVLACAAERRLRVFVPEDAEPPVLAQIASLGANIEVCPRKSDVLGDPTYHRFREAVNAGAIPFSCQGPDQALAVQGGKTMAWEIVCEDEPPPERLFVQVGGGALASALFSTFDEAVNLGLLEVLPRMFAIQTRGCYPLARAYERLVTEIVARHRFVLPEDDELRALAIRDKLGVAGVEETVHHAARNRLRFMQPWDGTPHSIAHGILDDETYDWLAIVRAMLLSGGYPILVDDNDISVALEMGWRETGIEVCATGAASLAGLSVLAKTVPSVLQQRAAVLFSGHRRDAH